MANTEQTQATKDLDILIHTLTSLENARNVPELTALSGPLLASAQALQRGIEMSSREDSVTEFSKATILLNRAVKTCAGRTSPYHQDLLRISQKVLASTPKAIVTFPPKPPLVASRPAAVSLAGRTLDASSEPLHRSPLVMEEPDQAPGLVAKRFLAPPQPTMSLRSDEAPSPAKEPREQESASAAPPPSKPTSKPAELESPPSQASSIKGILDTLTDRVARVTPKSESEQHTVSNRSASSGGVQKAIQNLADLETEMAIHMQLGDRRDYSSAFMQIGSATKNLRRFLHLADFSAAKSEFDQVRRALEVVETGADKFKHSHSSDRGIYEAVRHVLSSAPMAINELEAANRPQNQSSGGSAGLPGQPAGRSLWVEAIQARKDPAPDKAQLELNRLRSSRFSFEWKSQQDFIHAFPEWRRQVKTKTDELLAAMPGDTDRCLIEQTLREIDAIALQVTNWTKAKLDPRRNDWVQLADKVFDARRATLLYHASRDNFELLSSLQESVEKARAAFENYLKADQAVELIVALPGITKFQSEIHQDFPGSNIEPSNRDQVDLVYDTLRIGFIHRGDVRLRALVKRHVANGTDRYDGEGRLVEVLADVATAESEFILWAEASPGEQAEAPPAVGEVISSLSNVAVGIDDVFPFSSHPLSLAEKILDEPEPAEPKRWNETPWDTQTADDQMPTEDTRGAEGPEIPIDETREPAAINIDF